MDDSDIHNEEEARMAQTQPFRDPYDPTDDDMDVEE